METCRVENLRIEGCEHGLGFNGEFSLVDKIYHSDYSAFDYRAGVEVNLEMDKVVIATLGENMTQGKMRITFEDSKFLCMERIFI